MKFVAYESYKPSDSTWLSTIPDTWQQIRGRFVMSANPASARLRHLDNADEVSFVPMEAVGENGGLNLDRTKPLDEIGSGYTEFEDGDVVIAKITPCFENGKSALASGLKNGVAFGTTELHVLRVSKRLNNRFLFYLTTSQTFRMLGESEMYGAGGQKRVPPEFVKNFRVPLPPLEEQQTIADFLDAQTAKIDTLLAKKRQFIEKLKEKRSALIARTVTRGLPPSAAQAAGLEPYPAMKDSGVEWVGDVPAHWGVTRLGFLCSKIGSGKTPSGGADAYVDEGIMFLRSQNVYDEGLMLDDVVFIPEEIDNEMQGTRVKPRDILLNVTGASLGRTCIVPTEFVNANVNQHVCIIRLADLNQSTFIAWVIKAPFIKAQIEAIQSGAAREGLNFDQIAKLALALPPLEEQQAIAAYLDRETARIDQLTAKVEAAIARLTEYRQTLITAAVTGKIDVRARTVG